MFYKMLANYFLSPIFSALKLYEVRWDGVRDDHHGQVGVEERCIGCGAMVVG